MSFQITGETAASFGLTWNVCVLSLCRIEDIAFIDEWRTSIFLPDFTASFDWNRGLQDAVVSTILTHSDQNQQPANINVSVQVLSHLIFFNPKKFLEVENWTLWSKRLLGNPGIQPLSCSDKEVKYQEGPDQLPTSKIFSRVQKLTQKWRCNIPAHTLIYAHTEFSSSGPGNIDNNLTLIYTLLTNVN